MVTVKRFDALGTLGSVSKTPLAEQVVMILKRFILLEDMQEGDRLPSERQLTAILGVSHRVIREALSVLVDEGIIVKEHGRGAFLRTFDRKRLQAGDVPLSPQFSHSADLREARHAIEIGVMPIVVERATEEDLAKLQKIVDSMRQEAERGASLASADLLFHRSLLRATHNEALQQFDALIGESIRHSVYDLPGMLHRQVKHEPHVIRAHQAIVDALNERDDARAILAMYNHLKSSLMAVLSRHDSQPNGDHNIREYHT